MTINLTGTVLASILFEQSNSTCDKEGLVLGKISNIIKDTISDSSLNQVEHQTVYHVHSFLHCEKLFSWYDARGRVQTEALTEILARYSPEDVIGWYKLRQNSSLMPSIRESYIHQHLEEWMKQRNINRRLVFFLCVSHSSYEGALYTTDHQFMIQDGGRFKNMTINIMNLGNISKPNYQTVPNVTCSVGSSYDSVVKKLRSNFVNGMNELGSVKKVDAMKFSLHEQLKKICAKLIKSETELGKETLEVKNLRMQLQSIEEFIAPSLAVQNDLEVCGNSEQAVDSTPMEKVEQMDVEDSERSLIVFDDDDDLVTPEAASQRVAENQNQEKERSLSVEVKSRPAASANHSHLLDESSEAFDAIQLLDDSGDEKSDATAVKRQKPGTLRDEDPFEYLTDISQMHSVAGSSSHGLRSQSNVSPEPDLRSGVGRTPRRTRGPRQTRTDSDATSSAAAYGGPSERTRKKVYERDEN